MNEKQVLLEAINLLNKNGWCQGRGRKKNAYCMLEAISDAGVKLGNPDAFNNIWNLLYAKVSPKRSVAAWNDDSRRTKKEVIQLLQSTADNL